MPSLPWIAPQRRRTRCAGWDRRRARFVCRHERAVPDVRGTAAHTGRSESGDGRPGRGEPGGRPVPRIPGKRQLVAHSGGRGHRGKDAADGSGGCTCHCRHAYRAPNLLEQLPNSVLAAVVIASAIGLFEIADLRRIYRIQRWEFWLSVVCTAGVTVFGAIPGIALAIVIAVIEFLWDGWRPHSAVLGRVDQLKGYHDITRYPAARRVPGLVLFRWDAPLFFANAEFFNDRVRAVVTGAPTPVRRVVVAAEPVTSVDVTAADVLADLKESLNRESIELCFAEMKDPVKDKLKRFGLFDLGEGMFFATVGEAVEAYVRLPRRLARLERPRVAARVNASRLLRAERARNASTRLSSRRASRNSPPTRSCGFDAAGSRRAPTCRAR